MPARTLNDFLAGFLKGQRKASLEVKMANAGQSERRKGNRRQGSRRKGDIRIFRSEEDKNQEVTVHHEAVLRGKERSIWGWHEKFAIAWSDTFITKKRKRNPSKEE
jgi:hypothetical protein